MANKEENCMEYELMYALLKFGHGDELMKILGNAIKHIDNKRTSSSNKSESESENSDKNE